MPRINLRDPQRDCENVLLHEAHGPRQDTPFLLPADHIRAVSARLEGSLFFDAEPGWNPLVASLYGMTVLSLLVLARGVGLELGAMEPGGPQLTPIAFGAPSLLLAQVFRRGVRLENEQRLTV